MWWCVDLMTWWHDDMTIWRHDDIMYSWCDYMIAKWRAGMMMWWCYDVMIWQCNLTIWWCDGIVECLCADVMMWWCCLVMLWWCDDVVIWWSDDMMMWWCDDVIIRWCDDVVGAGHLLEFHLHLNEMAERPTASCRSQRPDNLPTDRFQLPGNAATPLRFLEICWGRGSGLWGWEASAFCCCGRLCGLGFSPRQRDECALLAAKVARRVI